MNELKKALRDEQKFFTKEETARFLKSMLFQKKGSQHLLGKALNSTYKRWFTHLEFLCKGSHIVLKIVGIYYIRGLKSVIV